MFNYIITFFSDQSGVDLRQNTQIRIDMPPTTDNQVANTEATATINTQPLPLPTADPLTFAEGTPVQDVEIREMERRIQIQLRSVLCQHLAMQESKNDIRQAKLFVFSTFSCCIGATTCALPCTVSPQIGSIFFCAGAGICIYQRTCIKYDNEDEIRDQIESCNARLATLTVLSNSHVRIDNNVAQVTS